MGFGKPPNLKETVAVVGKIIDILRIARRWVLFYGLIGLIAGLGSVAFYILCRAGMHYFLDLIAGYRPPPPDGELSIFSESSTPFRRWLLLLVPAFGGLLSGLLVYTFCPEAEGHGTDAAIEAYHQKGGLVRFRVPFIKMVASFLTIGSGGSGGREGPIAQIGAGFGSFLATKLKLSSRERRIMLAAGMGAGIGSIFRAPLAGALFAAEVMYKESEFESDIIMPAAISSIVAYSTFCLFFGWGALFKTEDFTFHNPLELGPYAVLALVVTGVAIIYVKSFYGIRDLFKKLSIPNHFKPAIGGLLTGIIGFFLPQTLAFGYGFLQTVLNNQVTIPLLFAVALGKIFTTSFSIGSGGSGGVFGPSVVIGGALGGAIGNIFHQIMPRIVDQPASFVIVGMAGFFSAASKAPIATILMVSEMTGSYHLLLPGMMVCTMAFLLSKRWTIYEKQVPTKVDSPAHTGEFFIDVLAGLRVKEMLGSLKNVTLIPQDMKFKDFVYIFSKTEQHYFPVVDDQNRLVGIFSINDVRQYLFDKDLGEIAVMKDIANTDIIVGKPSDSLHTILKKFTIKNIDELPIVSENDERMLLGMLRRREVINLYNQKVLEMKLEQETGRD